MLKKLAPKSIAALKPQVHPLMRPRFWGPIGILLILGGVFWELAENPERFQVSGNSSSPPIDGNLGQRLTDEDKAIAADIDSSGLLIQELQEFEPMSTDLINNPILVKEQALDLPQGSTSIPSGAQAQNPLLPQFLGGPEGSDPAASASSGYDLLNFGALRQSSSSSRASNSANPSQTSGFEAEPGPAQPGNPLQAAMDREAQSSAQNRTTGSEESQGEQRGGVNSANSSANSGVNAINSSQSPTTAPETSNNAAVNPIAVGQLQPSTVPQPPSMVPPPTWTVPRATVNPGIPSISPAVPNAFQTDRSIPQAIAPVQSNIPVTASTLTPSSPSYSRFYPGLNGNSALELTNPGYNSSFSIPVAQPVQVNPNVFTTPTVQTNPLVRPQPFSIPRSVPGRTIGGGEINTFANP
ncbi:MAG: hypothetical protein ACRC8A_19060 [Microcoleaceae cyanobacterium]